MPRRFYQDLVMDVIWLTIACLSLLNCSLMPDELEEFYTLPLPEVTHLAYAAHGNQISYVQTGNSQGVPVVFVHGSPGSWEDWKLVIVRPQLQSLFKLVALDRPGWGRNAQLSSPAPKVSQQSRLLRPVLDAVAKGEKVILVGHSLGGPIVVQMAIDDPARVAAVVLLAPSLDPDLDAVLWFNRLADYMLVKMILPDMLVRANDEILALPQELHNLAARMKSINIPVIVVYGQKDALVHPGNALFARRKLVNAAYKETRLVNFGHLIPQLRPGEVVLAIETAYGMIGEQ